MNRNQESPAVASPLIEAIRATLAPDAVRLHPEHGVWQVCYKDGSAVPRAGSKGYQLASIPGFGRIPAHRAMWMQTHGMEIPEGCMIDHIDRNPHNNAAINLRLVTPGENRRNATTPNTERPSFAPPEVVNCGWRWWGWFNDGRRWYSTPQFRLPLDACFALVRLKIRVMGRESVAHVAPFLMPEKWLGTDYDLHLDPVEDAPEWAKCSALVDWEAENPEGSPPDEYGFPQEMLFVDHLNRIVNYGEYFDAEAIDCAVKEDAERAERKAAKEAKQREKEEKLEQLREEMRQHMEEVRAKKEAKRAARKRTPSPNR